VEEHVEAWKENRRERNLVALDLDTARERRDHSLIARLEAQLDKLDDAERPSPVMVWTPEQTGEFLDGIQNDRLYPFFHLIAYRGTRRGETCGARWVDLNKAKSSLKVSEQLVQLGWKVEAGKPKSDAGDRTIGLDDVTNNVLEAWRKTQIAEQLAYGPGWIRLGRIFTRRDGSELHPAWITKYFNQLVANLGLPPIRLHDLRHGAATRALEAEIDIKIVQELLGHSSSTLTRDTYTAIGQGSR
jgi:integrase